MLIGTNSINCIWHIRGMEILTYDIIQPFCTIHCRGIWCLCIVVPTNRVQKRCTWFTWCHGTGNVVTFCKHKNYNHKNEHNPPNSYSYDHAGLVITILINDTCCTCFHFILDFQLRLCFCWRRLNHVVSKCDEHGTIQQQQ